MIVVAHYLRDAGMEVVLLGNCTTDQIIKSAIEEDADIVGISTYCGGELVLGKALLEGAKKADIDRRVGFLIGGVIPQGNVPKLKEIGFAGVFLTATRNEIVDCIKGVVSGHKIGA